MDKKYLTFVRLMLLTAVAGLFVSCADTSSSSHSSAGTNERFRDVASVDVAFQFFRWDSIYMTRPDSRENNFYPIYSREELPHEIAARRLGKDLAVVVMGYIFSPDLEQQYIRDWNTLLFSQGYKRVIVLRSNNTMDIDGLPIVYDSVTGSGHESTTVAAIPTAR